jgi:hypothetical protein
MTKRSKQHTEYPSPTIVVGMGKFGLAVLERLGEDWEGLERATEDASLKNLRLLHVRADDDVPDSKWRAGERQFVEIARYTGDGDLPSLALDFVILRSLGLIRYRNGTYQIAVPLDAGVVEVPTDRDTDDFARRRYFDWKSLSPDPISSVERLRVLKARQPDLDLFVTPLVNRIRQGHSPRAVLGCISRCRALAEGRDPCPWAWLFEDLVDSDQFDGHFASVALERDWLEPNDISGLLEGMADEPLEGWREWLQNLRRDGEELDVGTVDFPVDGFNLVLPRPFMPQASDLASPITPFDLLKVDWETTGWATKEMNSGAGVEFNPVQVSPFRLGLFDHDDCSRIHQSEGDEFCARLRELAVHAHRGLVRMWVDLQRERVESPEEEIEPSRQRESVDDSLDQSLEVLGELLVRPLITERAGDAADVSDDDLGDTPERSADLDLPADASTDLRNLVVEEPSPDNAARDALDERLAALGFAPDATENRESMLFDDVALRPEEIDFEPGENTIVDPDLLNQRSQGLLELRNLLNERTRQLFDFSFLKQYRNEPSKRVPRLSIYVVCDATEAFSRASMRTVLREIHAELLRAYGPIFETYREGFDRALSVVPIIWMPHPADSFGGKRPLENRCEEAAIIESIQGVRRWIESVPLGKRCVPQVVINSRVTDNAVLSVWDSIRQTRDFLKFQTRNNLAGDSWLRRTATGTRGDDIFASFSCHEIEFPAERAREYLANRYARHSITRIRDGEQGPLPDVSQLTKQKPIEPPRIDELVSEPAARLGETTGRAADRMEQKVLGQLEAAPATTVDQVEARFAESFERDLLDSITRQWQGFTRRRGEMDDMVDALRRDTSDRLGQTLQVVKDAGDTLIEKHASKGGLKRAYAGFGELHSLARDHLRGREDERGKKEAICQRHRIPKTNQVGSTRKAVVEEGRAKPELSAMNTGLVFWACMAPVMGAPIAWAVAKALDLHLNPNAVEFVLGPLGPLIGGLLVFVPVFFLLRWYMNKHVERLQAAIDRMADAVKRVVDGGPNALQRSPSIRSFMEARLAHTATLATRSYARQVYERILKDLELASRLRRSLDLQHDVLMRRAEELGVQLKMTDLDSEEGEDDLKRLFNSRFEASGDKLIDPEHLVDYYERRIGGDHEVDELLESFIEEVGGFRAWRRIAALSDTPRILRYTRTQFDELIDQPVSDQFTFEDEVRERLIDFVMSNYSNIGFGAKFSGYEGLDPDGVDVLARTALVLHPGLKTVFDEARKDPDAPARLKSLDVKTAAIEPNAAYMLSLAQGIRPHSVRNLRRFESFHHRAQMPDDRAFPLSGDSTRKHASAPINHLSGYDSLRDSINRGVFQIARKVEREGTQPAIERRPVSEGRPVSERPPVSKTGESDE